MKLNLGFMFGGVLLDWKEENSPNIQCVQHTLIMKPKQSLLSSFELKHGNRLQRHVTFTLSNHFMQYVQGTHKSLTCRLE
jgi:hypothetical protein